MKKLYLLDAYALIFRAHFAFIRNPRINSKGLNTSAIFGFVNSLLEVLNKEKPTHIAVVFDVAGRNVREKIYEEYKANRDETPEDIRLAVPYIHKILEAMNIPALGVEGYEADDVIGTLAKKAEKAGFQTYMVTPDKDYAQLVSENIFMWKPGRSGNPSEVWDVEKVKEKFDVERPEQVIDILGLWGDSVDNIPGIPGIGEKTSKKLVKQYGSVEGLIEHAEELKGKQKENVINFAEQGLMSKELATIILDVPVELDEKALVYEDPDNDKVIEVFSELEFRTLLKKVVKDEDASLVPTASTPSEEDNGQMSLFGEQQETVEELPDEFKSLENAKELNYTLVEDEKGLKKALKSLSKYKEICFDTETSSLDELDTTLLGIALSGAKNEAWYIAVPQEFNARMIFRKALQKFFSNEKITWIAHNVKFDLKVLKREKITVQGQLFDTMIAHYLLEPEQRHNMDVLSETYLNYKPVSIETLIGPKGKNQKSMADLQPSEIKDYACEDADVTFQLFQLFKDRVDDSYLEKLFYEVEMPLVRVLMEMEMEGINLDVEALGEFSEELNTELIDLQQRIIDAAGVEFNVDSPKQLGDVLFETMNLSEKAKKTKTGQYKTDEATLVKLQGKHPIIDDILEYRQMKKLKSTYVDALPKLVNPKTGRIHTTYFQTVAATGRLSSNHPNLQNIPIRSTRGKEIRKAFKARSTDYKIMAADYSQIELRIIAALSGDKGMIEAFKSGQDIHAATAAKVFDVPLEEVSREQRSKAKMVNFGIIYGISAFGLSQRLGISRTEAKEIIDNYFEKYSRIKEYMDESIEFARKHEYVETILKRRRYLPKINAGNGMERGFAERNAINAPIQGSAADVIKIAMINVQERMKKEALKSKLLLQVHDELVFDVHKDEVDLMRTLAKEEMERAVQLEVPLEVEEGVADNWLDAH
ncbi:DNA polymerase I [Parvicella tangerina]|uniref:DNA polymerase I n=1 Tax=Parvicella tangerina TaxID=2829795 RepID=A0A916JMU5_9FLAO|nr:DNA polymerase I [Parvicella tangerina]CAG5082438.1 DNA polymerase I [Parvicella tangerina]